MMEVKGNRFILFVGTSDQHSLLCFSSVGGLNNKRDSQLTIANNSGFAPWDGLSAALSHRSWSCVVKLRICLVLTAFFRLVLYILLGPKQKLPVWRSSTSYIATTVI